MAPSSLRIRRVVVSVLAFGATTIGSGVSPAHGSGSHVWWVATSGAAASPATSGSSCANPSFVGATHSSIQAAISAATAGDEIRICGGTYAVGATITVGKNLTISGTDSTETILDAGGTRRIMEQTTTGTSVTVNRLHFHNGFVTGGGQRGAGILMNPNAHLIVNDSHFFNNRAINDHGGGIALIGDLGGSNTGTLQVNSSSFYKNHGFDGGAIVVVGNQGASNVRNSTFVANTAGREGGALNGSFGNLNAFSSTFVDNSAPNGGDTSWVVSITASLVAYSPSVTPSSDVCYLGSGALDSNVSTVSSCLSSGSTVTYSSLALGIFAPWGGHTPTVALGSGSSAIDAIASAKCSSNDQRGISRSGSTCDAGAFEYHATSGSISISSPMALVENRLISDAPSVNKASLTEPVVFSIYPGLSSQLPGNVSFSTSTGQLSGTPATTPMDRFYVITATDSNGTVTSAHLVIDNCALATQSGKYVIASRDDLNLFRISACGLDADYIQTADIAWSSAWQDFTLETSSFAGSYDGGGHSITGLQISGGRVGFISYTNGASITNLRLGVTLSGAYSSGGLVRLAQNTTITGVHVSGTVSTPISESDRGCLGGLVGETTNGTIIRSSSFTGSVDGPNSDWVGGLVGCAYAETLIEESSVDGTVTGANEVGGLIGWMDASDIRNSYVVGSVIGNGDRVGTLAGWLENDGSDAGVVAVTNSYASAQLQGVAKVGALVGEGTSTSLDNSYWEAGLTGVDGLLPIGQIIDQGGTQPALSAATATEMKSRAFFTTAGWGMVDGWQSATSTSNKWGICDGVGRPFLLAHHASSPCVPSSNNSPSNNQTPPSNNSSTPSSNQSSSPASSSSTTASGSSANAVAVSASTGDASTGSGPKVAAGKTVVLRDGKRVKTSLEWTQNTTIQGSIGDVDLALKFGRQATAINLPATVLPGSSFALNLVGLKPGSTVIVTIYSEPSVLGTFTATAAGTIDSVVTVPKKLATGSHRLRIDMLDELGRTVAAWVGVSVASNTTALPATGSPTNQRVLYALALVLFGLGVLGARRQDDRPHRRMMWR